MAGSKPVLFSFFWSSCAWRVRIALALKGIDYEYKGLNLFKGEHLAENFVKLNPSAEVPTLIHNGNVLTHSTAILEYLEEVVPSPPLLPKDPVTRAKVRALVDSIAASIQPLQNMRVLKYVGKNSSEWGRHWIVEGFAPVERYLKGTHGLYCVGDNITFADLCLVPQVFNCNRFSVEMSQFPLISEISSRLLEQPAFKVTHPLVQPDCPADIKK